MKVLFITKPFIIEPLGIMYLSAAAKAAGHKTDLARISDDLEKKVEEFEPDIVAYSLMTGDQDLFLDLNQSLKRTYQFLSVFGGPHPTFFPELINQDGVDIVCRGEGEPAFVDLLNKQEKAEDITQIENLFVKRNGRIIQNGVRPLADIDSLPFPDREIVFQFPEIKKGPIKHFIASRGCPYNCSYCFNEKYSQLYSNKGKRVRFRNVISLVDEIEDVVKSSPTRFVYFQDDTFTLNKNWLKDFTKEYAERVNLPFHCHVRPNTVDEETVNLLKQAGCYSVHIAAETANDRLRNDILNRRMTREQIIKATILLREHGIRLMLQNIIGLPTGSLEDDLATLEMNIEAKPDYAWVSIYQPYPGTKLGEYCRRQEYYMGDFSDLSSNFFDSSNLNFPGRYKNQLSHLQKLFAIFVEYPELHRLGLSQVMIDIPNTEETRERYQTAYKQFRKKGDKRLYGFDL